MTNLQEERPQGMPVDLTKEEFTAYHMATAKAFGMLRRQGAMMVLFGIYVAITVVGLIQHYQATGEVSVVMLLITLVTVAMAVLSMTMMPAAVKKKARLAYDIGDVNGYYGEWTITPTAIVKETGETRVEMPLNEKTLYVEDVGFMAFVSAGADRIIILPARCMTEAAAKTVRETVFASGSRVQRRVIKRMTALAEAPIPRRELLSEPQTLYTVDVTYEEAELAQLHADIAWKHYVHNLPNIVSVSLLFAAMFALIEENVPLFFIVALGIPLVFLIFTTLSGRATAKRTTRLQPTRLRFSLTDRGVRATFSPSEQTTAAQWNSIRRAVERPTCVEFYYGDDHLLRIPKRCIDDMNELRRLVDTYHTPKA